MGITQSDLAASLKVPASTAARLESGRLAPDQHTLDALGILLECPPETLASPAPDLLYTRPWLRAYADAPKKTVDQYISDSLVAVEAFETLKLRRMPDRLPTFDGDANSDLDIDDFAAEVRVSADINAGTGVPNVTRAAERLGCIVLPMVNELGKHLGLSTRADSTPVIRVSRATPNVPGDRQRFTIAHELGHLLLHATAAPPDSSEQAKVIEKQAHRFAAAFLLPGDAFLEELNEVSGGRVTLSVLASLKERWGVSIKAMVVRLQHLDQIDAYQARSLYKQISARGWNTNEPVYVGNERAVWLEKALRQRYAQEGAFELAAADSGLNTSWFERWTTWEDPQTQNAAVVDLNSRRRRASSVIASDRQ